MDLSLIRSTQPQRRTPRLGAFFAALCLLTAAASGCGDDTDDGGGDTGPDPLQGVYEVTSHTITPDACGSPEPVAEPDVCNSCAISTGFLELRDENLFGARFLAIVECSDASTCDPDANLGAAFYERDGEKRIGETKAAVSGGGDCTFTLVRFVGEPTADGVQITVSTYTTTRPEFSECEAMVDNPPPVDQLTCSTIEVIDAKRVK